MKRLAREGMTILSYIEYSNCKRVCRLIETRVRRLQILIIQQARGSRPA